MPSSAALTAVQRNALMAALSSRRSGDEVIALIEAEFAKAPTCGHCGSEEFSKWGVASGMKRYKCETCERTFNALTGTPLAHLQKREKWLEYARAIVDGLSLRKAAKRVGVHLETSFRWRHRFLATCKGRQGNGRHRHRGGGRDLHPQVGQRIEASWSAETAAAVLLFQL